MKKLQIIWLHSHLSNWGGGTKFVYNVTKELSKNHSVSIFVQKSSKEIIYEFEKIPIPVTTLSKSSTGSFSFWLNFEKQIKKEISILKDNNDKFDIVISSMFPMNIVGNSICLPHIQYCFEPFAFFWDKFMIKNLPFYKRSFLTFLIKKFRKKDLESTKKSEIILTVNSGTKQWIKEIYKKDSIPTLLGVDTTYFNKILDKDLQKKYANKKIIIHSTDWTPLKRTNWIIDQFVDIQKKLNDSILLITEVITTGKERDLALKKIKEHNLNVILCGFVSQEMLPKYYSLADVAVYAGIGQGASSASLFVLECMSCETSVIRTNDTNEEVQHNKTGYLFEASDTVNFQKYLLELLTDASLREKFGKNGRQFIEENYSWKKVSDIFEKNCFRLLDIKS